MGLDMYLQGRKFLWTDWEHPENNPTEDGFEIRETVLKLGYWRKHPNLHGFIVKEFAGGVDDCREIDLPVPALRSIIAAIQEKRLPPTEGFFFGRSDGSEDAETIATLEKAIAWVTAEDPKSSRSVIYRASW